MSKVRRTKETVMNDSAHNGELVFRPLPQTVIEANVNPQELSAAYASARNDGLEFWADAARELDWFRPWDAVLDSSRAPRHTWFPGE